MPFTPERATVNQRVQIGTESTSALGTVVPAGKLLECYDIVLGINGDVKFYRATGHKYDTEQEEGTEWVDGTLGGNLDYNGVLYPLASLAGSVSPGAHGTSAVAKDWVYVPPTTGSIVPQTYTIQQGDSTRAHQIAYGIVLDFGYKGTRKDISVSGKLVGQNLSDGITLTSSPTPVAMAPVASKHINVYLDPSSANLGVTQLLRVLSIDYQMTGTYGTLYVFNRATLSWVAHVDLAPKAIFKLKLEADASGMAPLGYLETGTTYWLRVDAQGTVIDNNQTVTLGVQSTGTFTLTYKGQTTSALAFGATGATVQTALIGLSTIGAGNATVTGGAGGPYIVAFAGTLALDTTALTGNFTALTTPANASITQTQAYNKFTHDMAVKFNKPSTFADDQGVFAIEWEAQIVEDPTWGKAQQFTVTNLITAL